jgi:hypothetical protein
MVMKKILLILSLTVIASMIWSGAMADIIYSDDDTMKVEDVYGFPGDTVEVGIAMSNVMTIEAFNHRIVYDETLLDLDAVYCVDRGCNPEVFQSLNSDPGVVKFIAYSLLNLDYIYAGSGPVVKLSFIVRENATPGEVAAVAFENEENISENAWADSLGVNLIIPVLADGQVEVINTTGIDSEPVLPGTFELLQNYPNPFNAETMISFSLESSQDVELKVYDILGHEVATLFSGRANAGRTDILWDAKTSAGRILASGIYYYRLAFEEGQSLTRRMTLLK